ncbi:hypothetical protein PRIPAC_85728 [Pristionchus pacificus]|uniref:G protein-coupled receptor n=1 Tax=Pristionchus pacificus TaxID=54126 RepID=A0A2A6BTC6_PRIPA|nr:hypothetical protein PRIPAC_85728 [Pristionchus pacificus]|eukprot:PDM69063.1 G protein-coupled receptor [Pristionchus pacificus]
MNVSNEELELAIYMANSVYMQCVIAFRIVTALLGIISLFTMLYMRWQITHGSLVILITQHTLWALLMSLWTLLEACTTGYAFLTWRLVYISFVIECYHLINIRYPEDLFMYKDSVRSITSIVVVTIERGVAFLRRSSYEKTSIQLGIVLSIINVSLISLSILQQAVQLFFTALLQYGLYLHYDFDDLSRFRCTVITKSGKEYHQIMAARSLILLTLELFTIASFLLLLRLNRAKLAGECKTLSERYQISENIRTLEYLVPIISSTTALNVGAIFLFVLFNKLGLDRKEYALCEVITCLIHSESMVNITSDEIALAKYLATSTFMHLIVILRLIIGIVGLLAFLALVPFRKNVFTPHKSLVLLLTQHCLWSFIQSAAVTIDNCIVAYKQLTFHNVDVLFFLNGGFSCFLRSGACMLSFQGGIYSLLVITIERCYASKKYRTYERTGLHLGVVLSLVQFLLASFFFYLIVHFYEFDKTYARYNIATDEGMIFHKFQGVLLIIIQLFSLIMFYRLLKSNKRQLESGCSTLTERYQLTENVKTLHLLVPVVCSHISLNLFVVTTYMEALGFLHLHSVIVPLIMNIRHRRELSSQRKLFKVNDTYNRQGFADRHLTVVQRAW